MTAWLWLRDAVLISMTTLVLIVITRLVIGSYPPLWVFFAIGGATCVAWAVGATVGRRARDE